MTKAQTKPRQILLSKRANVFYLEHVRVLQKDERIVYLTDNGEEVERFFNVPERNTAFVLLGKGSSITDAAARRMAESNVIVGFVGNGGAPLFGMSDFVFMSPQSEYRPPEYMQAWAAMWLDEAMRLRAARHFMHERVRFAQSAWGGNGELAKRKIGLSDSLCATFFGKVNAASDTASLMAVEAEWARMLYAMLARAFALDDFKREEGKKSKATLADTANAFLDHGNYLAYGYAAVALVALGISFAFPVLHGKTRRGALVFDVADLYKDAVVMPLAFRAAREGYFDQTFRDELVDACLTHQVIDFSIDTIKKVCVAKDI